ncbi:NADH:flavin oxidoreductase/NADH oxidase [Geomonas sp.]|uniref:NADH:flavin oxidoreductase/NADH oxidase n=1 Tax=Geomonas sp. TaxID=2651584 RepID=UPI002B4A8BB7|nr:NADH:flavin oxidoreductase/NADH oxidase [Geomonas sp.]HJV33427.1 NADH:flavin oxidoreductase/NADH oxidase [Geomonas sp.]
MPHLFEPLTLRSVTLRNRIAVSPMCQYSSEDGFANEWHFVHLGSRAVGGAGLVMTEATAVVPEGRISPQDLGVWKDAHIEQLGRIAHFIRMQGGTPGMQLAHAGRKASTPPPWANRNETIGIEEGGWLPVAPSPIPFEPGCCVPHALAADELPAIVAAFAAAAGRALQAGFQVIELHAAHGYLLHEFLSPLSNHRRDSYGGSFENRSRLLRETVLAVRKVWPDDLPLLVRLSATDWVEGGWDAEQSVELVRELGTLGVDLVDCSTGGSSPTAKVPIGPGYQTSFADQIKRETGVMTGAVGLITDPAQADHVIRTGQADLVFLARELLRDPYWPLRAARELRHLTPWPVQYLRAAPPNSTGRS